jgi:outer membrane protein OmpA-like peptidoglycan-associated protein
MRYSKLKSTTSLVVSLAMVTAPLAAQETDIAACGDMPEFPCLIDGNVIEDRDEFEALQAEEARAAEQARIEAELTAAAEAEAQAAAEAEAAAAAAAEAEAAAAAEAEARAAAEAAEAAEAEARAAAEAADAAAAEEAAAAAAAAEEAARAEAEAAERAAADAAAAEAAAAEAEAAAAAEAEAAEADAAAAAAAEAAAAQAEAATEAEAADAAAAEQAAAEEAAAAAAAAEAAAEAEAAVAEEAEAAAAAEDDEMRAAIEAALAEREAELEAALAAQAEAEAALEEAQAEAEPLPPIVEPTTIEEQLAAQGQTPDETEEEAPVESAAAAADLDTDTTPEDAEVEVEVVTEDAVRSATEDFANRVTAEAPVASSNDRSGLSNFQRALLIGLGAAAVGTVLRNGDRVVQNSGDRVVVQRGEQFVVLKDDDVLLRQPGNEVQTQTFADGSTRTIVLRDDGTRIVTIRGADGTVQRRARILADGTQVELFNDTIGSAPVVVSQLPPAPQFFVETDPARIDVTTLRQALEARQRPAGLDRTFSLNQVRTIEEVRRLAPAVELDTLTFATGSAAIDPDQAAGLTDLGLAISAIVQNDPTQVFLVEGHTDATGPATLNLALSDRRAETVALALTEFFGVPPENLITQGFGERFLKVPTLEAERANRRVAIRNITSLIRQ